MKWVVLMAIMCWLDVPTWLILLCVIGAGVDTAVWMWRLDDGK